MPQFTKDEIIAKFKERGLDDTQAAEAFAKWQASKAAPAPKPVTNAASKGDASVKPMGGPKGTTTQKSPAIAPAVKEPKAATGADYMDKPMLGPVAPPRAEPPAANNYRTPRDPGGGDPRKALAYGEFAASPAGQRQMATEAGIRRAGDAARGVVANKASVAGGAARLVKDAIVGGAQAAKSFATDLYADQVAADERHRVAERQREGARRPTIDYIEIDRDQQRLGADRMAKSVARDKLRTIEYADVDSLTDAEVEAALKLPRVQQALAAE